MLAVQSIPGIVLAVPRFMVMKELGILNTYAGMIIPLAFDAFGIFLMKQFFEQLPRELEEPCIPRHTGHRPGDREPVRHVTT